MRPPRSLRSSRCFAAFFVLVLHVGRVTAQEVEAPPPADRGDATTDAAVAAALAHEQCTQRAVLEHEGLLYAACGSQGVLIFERTPNGLSLRERRNGLGDVRAVFVREDRIWVELQRLEALPLAHLPSDSSARTAPIDGTTPTSPAASQPKPRESRVAPPRIGNILRLEGALRAFLPIDDLGIGALAGFALTYHGKRHWYVRAEAAPVGGLAVRGRDNWVLGMFATGGYDHPLFALGVGVGTLRMQETDYYLDASSGSYPIEEGMRFAIGQSIRLGALDGLHVHCDTAFFLSDERWRFSFVDIGIQIPAGAHNWVIADGGGGDLANFFYFEAGLKRLISGERDTGSLFIAATAGVGAIEPEDTDGSEEFALGPMLGFRLEWRK